MTNFKISTVRSRLAERKEHLLRAFTDAVTAVAEPTPSGFKRYAGAGLELDGVRLQHLMDRLVEVDSALERLDEGEFGFCRRCGQEIDLQRITLIPEAQFCSGCASAIANEITSEWEH